MKSPVIVAPTWTCKPGRKQNGAESLVELTLKPHGGAAGCL
jgi:hypothetical protein